MEMTNRFITRASDCPALGVCRLVGNAREGCENGGTCDEGGMPTDICLASLILLVARGQGLTSEAQGPNMAGGNNSPA
jgi:hypothetical protein